LISSREELQMALKKKNRTQNEQEREAAILLMKANEFDYYASGN